MITRDGYNLDVAIDTEQQVAYWSDGAREDFAVAGELLVNHRVRHGMFFLHLGLEKILKANVSLITGDLPPRTHNLLTLVERAGLRLEPQIIAFLGDLDRFNLAGRYPDARTPDVSLAEAMEYRKQAQEVMECLARMLSR